MVEDDEEIPSEVPLSLIPYPYNRVPESFGRDTPEYPELRKLLIKTLDILDRGKGVLAPYAPKGKLQSFDVASIDVDPDSAILRVSEWQGANEIMNFLVNERLIKWDEYTEAYELVRRVQENVEEDDLPGDVSAFAKPQKNYDLKTLYREYDYMVGERMADKRFRKIMWKFKCTPEEIAEAIHLYEPSVPMDWLNHIVASVNKLKRAKESVELRPYPLNLLPAKLPALFRDVIEVLRDPDWILELDFLRRGGPVVQVVNLINTATGEIRQLPQDKGESIYTALKSVGALVPHPEYPKHFLLKKLHESVEEEDVGDVASFDKPARTELPERIAGSPTYYDAWKLFDDKFEELMEINNSLDPDQDTYAPVIPSGYGQFERWWLGLDDQGANEWPSPFGQITVQDIEKLEKEEPFEIFGLFSNIFYNHSLSELDPTIMEAICKTIMRSPEKKPSIRRLLGFQKDMVDFLEGPFAAQMSQNVKDLILSQNNTPQAIKERKIVASIADDPVKQDDLIKKAIADVKSHRRRA